MLTADRVSLPCSNRERASVKSANERAQTVERCSFPLVAGRLPRTEEHFIAEGVAGFYPGVLLLRKKLLFQTDDVAEDDSMLVCLGFKFAICLGCGKKKKKKRKKKLVRVLG